MQRSVRNISSLVLVVLMILAPAAWGADWKPLPSTADYQSQIDLDSVGIYGAFTLNRSYVRPQKLASGKTYSTLRSQYYTLCDEGKISLGMSQYYSEDGKLTHIDFRRDWRSKFEAPKKDSDAAAAMTQACDRLSGRSGSAGSALKKDGSAKPARRTVSTGSGIAITRNGLILTNEHVVRQCDVYQVVLSSTRVLKATLRAADAGNGYGAAGCGAQTRRRFHHDCPVCSRTRDSRTCPCNSFITLTSSLCRLGKTSLPGSFPIAFLPGNAFSK
jgi:S1-C subfamily serine protease